MKQIFTLLGLGILIQVNAQSNGTVADFSTAIIGSKVVRTINVIANDNTVATKTYTLDTFFYSKSSFPPNFSISKSGNNLIIQDIEGKVNPDTAFYIAIDQNGNRDTNVLILNKANINPDLYPGDCNKDQICNNIDVLNIGIAYGKSEIEREGIYKTDVWGPIRAYNWAQSSAVSNHKFADADGNGTVDSLTDIAVVYKNYNALSNTSSNVAYSPTGGDLFYIKTNDTFTVQSNQNNFQIELGLGTNGTTRSYGVAFTLKYDTTIFKSNQIQFNPSKWYTDQHNTLNFSRVNHSTGEIDFAIVRRNGSNEVGSGKLGVIDVVVVDILIGLTNGVNTNFKIEKAVLIDSGYNLIPVTIGTPKPVFVVKKSSSAIQVGSSSNFTIGQTVDHINISSISNKKSEVKVYNIFGSLVHRSSDWNGNAIRIETRHWNPGIYLIQYLNEVIKIQKY